MAKMKYYTVYLEGIDKTGKDTLRYYIWKMNKGLNVFCRGYISLEVYNRKFNRGADYEKPYKDALYVMLDVDKEDWEIRCAMTNEPKISYEDDSLLFNNVIDELKDEYKIVRFNTSTTTPYEIAKAVIKKINELNTVITPPSYSTNWHDDAVTEEELNEIGTTMSEYCKSALPDDKFIY